jgi:hypothetical protein
MTWPTRDGSRTLLLCDEDAVHYHSIAGDHVVFSELSEEERVRETTS